MAKIGYQIPNNCPLCGMPGDSLTHRLYRCGATREHWCKLPPRWLQEVASRPLLYNRGLSPNIVVNGKVDNYNFVLIGEDSDDLDTFTFRSSEGPVFLDGSCYNSKFPFATAGFALCQVDQAGSLSKAAYAAVPGSLPQTAALAEHAAFAVLTMLSERSDPVKAVFDCMSTIASYRQGFGFSCDWRRPTSIAWRAIANRDPDYKACVEDVTHLKHTNPWKKPSPAGAVRPTSMVMRMPMPMPSWAQGSTNWTTWPWQSTREPMPRQKE